ncbi:MAG: PadR family transcriptional regulator [Actinomycetota bacterium]|nr:PadR family transcriptional regulator [Actinomycetota bacterium]
MSGSRRSNPLALAVLVSLYERPMHPYEVAQTLRARAKQESVRLNYGSLYGVVDGLERRGLIRARETVREGRRPERTIYEITDAGAREASDWLSELLAVPAKEYPAFMAGLSFMAALPPEEVTAALSARARVLEFQLEQLRGVQRAAAKAGLPRLFFVETEYEHRLLQAELDFVGELVTNIESGSLGGLDLWRSFFAGDDTMAKMAAQLGEPFALPGEVPTPPTP